MIDIMSLSQNDQIERWRAKINAALLARMPFAEATTHFMGDTFGHDFFSSEAAWNAAFVSQAVLELRWPLAVIEGVRCRPVPDSVVRA